MRVYCNGTNDTPYYDTFDTTQYDHCCVAAVIKYDDVPMMRVCGGEKKTSWNIPPYEG